MKFHTRGDTDRFSVFTSPQLLAVVELFSTHKNHSPTYIVCNSHSQATIRNQ